MHGIDINGAVSSLHHPGNEFMWARGLIRCSQNVPNSAKIAA
jgi:hypothetical protein